MLKEKRGILSEFVESNSNTWTVFEALILFPLGLDGRLLIKHNCIVHGGVHNHHIIDTE
jgi:hypothetical protein